MVQEWDQTIFIDSLRAKAIIEQQNNLKITSIELLGQGFDNMAFLVNQEFVFRFPRRDTAITFMENEIALLPFIADHVSFPLSSPCFVGEPSELFPAPFAGYKKLSGTPLSYSPARLIDDSLYAKTLASWLKELHRIPVLAGHRAVLKGDLSIKLQVVKGLEKSKKNLMTYRSYFLDAGFSERELFYAIAILQQYNFDQDKKVAFVHGDLYSKHVLVDPQQGTLAGIIDWGDIQIAHPGLDLSVACMLFSSRALARFWEAYGADNEEKARALFRAFNHPIMLLPYCYEHKEENLKKWTILALKRAIELVHEHKKIVF